MANSAEIRARLGRLLANEISLRDFAKWLVAVSWHLQESDDGYALAEEIDQQLVQFDNDDEDLRAALKEIYDSSDSPVENRSVVVNLTGIRCSAILIDSRGAGEVVPIPRQVELPV